MPVQFQFTKQALITGALWILMGIVLQSSPMAAGGVIILLVLTPVTLVVDWLRFKARYAAQERPQFQLSAGEPRPQRLLPPPEQAS